MSIIVLNEMSEDYLSYDNLFIHLLLSHTFIILYHIILYNH